MLRMTRRLADRGKVIQLHKPMAIEVDILEDYIYNISPELLTTLLKDHTTSRERELQRNIFL